MPARKVNVSSCTYSSVPGTASGLSVANTTMDMVAVGPETRCQDEPNSAPTMAGTIAAYTPYCGGKPAIVA